MEDSVPLRATFQNSEYPAGIHRQSEDVNLLDSSRGTLSNGMPRMTEFVITAVEPDGSARPERKADYKGRIRTWPGILLLLGLIGAAAALITLNAMSARDKSATLERKYEYNLQNSRKIQDGLNSTDLVDDDGQVGNPKKYASMGCELPDYQSKNGQIYAVSKNGTEVPVGIKGVNWFGMETGNAIPFGLWENSQNGTTAYEIASFLARNKFNSVRLPICIKSVLNNLLPQKNLVNLNSNRALNISSYMSAIKSIVKSLAFRKVTVMISLHTLDIKKSGGAWFDASLGVSEDDFLKAVDMITKELCNEDYWNIIGLDLKNEPHECSWGGAAPDWQKGATLIGNRMLKGCPNWMAFVEGINKERSFTYNGKPKTYFDWWGGGLQDAGKNPVELTTPNKVVYAPHYYNTGVSPAWYLYGGGTPGPNGVLNNYIELDDDTLRANVNVTFMDMFGYLSVRRKEAVVMGEFAGLYANDAHPKLTTKRTTDFTIEAMLGADFAGGYMWSLNPESAYQFNPADKYGHFTEGLLSDDWLSPDKVFLEGMAAMDRIRDLKMFPCFPTTVSK